MKARIVIAALVAGALPAGCNIVAPVYLAIHGPEKTKKVHQLDKARPTVVFFDDRANCMPRRALRVAAAKRTERLLLDRGAVTTAISAEAALALASQDKYGDPMSVADIGRAVQADVIVYATVDSFTLSQDGATYAPAATVRVKVIDAKEDRRIWPEDGPGATIEIRPQAKTGDVPTDLASYAKAEQELAELMGERVAQLFYDHERRSPGNIPD